MVRGLGRESGDLGAIHIGEDAVELRNLDATGTIEAEMPSNCGRRVRFSKEAIERIPLKFRGSRTFRR